MDVVHHHHIIVETIMAQSALLIVNSLDNHGSDRGLAKIKRPCASVIEKAIHCEKGFTRGSSWWKVAASGKTTVQSPREEDWSADGSRYGILRADWQSAAGWQPALHWLH
jgi:hypothetical protein